MWWPRQLLLLFDHIVYTKKSASHLQMKKNFSASSMADYFISGRYIVIIEPLGTCVVLEVKVAN